MSISQEDIFIEKIKDGSARIGVIGLGYVGLPLVLRYTEEGFNVTGFDVDEEKVRLLNKGESYIKHISGEKIKSYMDDGLFNATTDMAELKYMDAIIICVPTPLNAAREPEMKYVVSTAEVIGKYIQKGQLVSLESTTYPGTTDELLLPLLSDGGLKVGEDFFLVYSPEREDPGRKDFTTKTIPKVVGGITKECLRAGSALYGRVLDKIVEVSSTRASEMTKLLENIYRCVNIALVNELKMLAEKMDLDLWEVIDASSTKPFGFQPFYPGPGLGGHCIPIDPFYLTWKAKQYGFDTRFIELAGEVNTSMPAYVIEKTEEALRGAGKNLKGSKVLVLGLAYKKDVDDMRESPSITLIEILKEKGAEVNYNDPYISATHKMREHDLQMNSVGIDKESLSSYDCVLIATDHTAYDYEEIVRESKLVVDSRGATRGIKSEKIVRA